MSVGLKAGNSFGSITGKIGKRATTISREIHSHRIVWDKKPYGKAMNRCANRQGCRLRGVWALFKIFCKDDFCDEIRDSKIQEPEAVPPFPLR